jgi:probable HAF family extracellular repeat protein
MGLRLSALFLVARLVLVAALLLASRAGASSMFVLLPNLPGASSYAHGVSADGSVVVGQSNASGVEAFRWTSDGGVVGLGDLPGEIFDSVALGVSADGSVVVGSSNGASGNEAFRWTSEGGMVGLGDLAGGTFNSRASAVSADGSVSWERATQAGTVTPAKGTRRSSGTRSMGCATSAMCW